MTEGQPLQQRNRFYSIALMKKDSEWCVYHVKIAGDVRREFFVEITAAQTTRDGVTERLESLCEANFDSLPKDGGTIYLNLNDASRKS